MSNLPVLPEAAPSYLAALLQQHPELAAINQEALSGSAKPMPPSIVADKGHFVKKADGTEETITFPDTDVYRNAGIVGQPVPQLQAVILKGKPGKEKAWYATKYTPGQEAQSPDCYSDDGVKPAADCRLKQCENCASCPQNVFGSGTNADGTPSGGKACADRKVVAIYASGAAFRFAIPPASLKNWDSYCNQLSTKGLPLPAVITIIGFETGDTSYKLTFSFGGMLAEAQLGAIVKLLETPEVADITAPRSGQAALPAPAAASQDNVTDLAAEKAKREATEKEEKDRKAAEAKAEKERKAAEAKAEKERKAADAQSAAGLDLGLDLGAGAQSAAGDTATASAGTTDQPSDNDLIASLGL